MTRRSSSKPEEVFSEDAFWKKIARIPQRTSARLIHQALILYCLLTDAKTPVWVRVLIAITLMYLVNPLDAMPDAIPGVGLADDAAAIALLLTKLAGYVTPAIEARAASLLPWSRTKTAATTSTQNHKIRKSTPRRPKNNGQEETDA